MDLKIIEDIVKKVENSQVHKVTVTDGDQSVTVVNRFSSQPRSHSCSVADGQTRADTQQIHKTNNSISEDTAFIRSNYVGNVLLSPDGAAESLVKKGDTIEVGQTVAYVNVLSKLLPIESTLAGIVDNVLVDNGQAVEYSQPIIQLV